MRNAQREPKRLQPTHQVIINGQSLGERMIHFKDALQFYLPGYTVINAAIGGTGYTGLRKGTIPFLKGIEAGGDVVVIVHGELESILGTARATYSGYLQTWRDDYAEMLNKPNLKVLFCQCSSQAIFGFGAYGLPPTVLGQWDAAFDGTHTGLYMMGPKYYFPYHADATHLTTPATPGAPSGVSWMGQKYAQVLARLINTGNWEPLYVTSINRSGADITLNLNVPVGSIVFDTTTMAAHPNGKYGLSYEDADGAIGIATTPVIAGNTITFSLASPPTASPRVIRYGYWTAAGTTPVANGIAYPNSYAVGGMTYGNIRDSDTVASYVDSNAYQMGNWLVHFEMDVP